MIEIRRAVLDDVPALAELNGQLGYPSTDVELRHRLEPILASAENALLVAVDGGSPIGWIHVAIELGLGHSDTAGLRGLVVDEGHRSAGIGRDLLRAAEAWAREHGCTAMTVRSRVAREGAHRFYLREGFTRVKTSHVFGKPLV